jgi:hypothetical protein
VGELYFSRISFAKTVFLAVLFCLLLGSCGKIGSPAALNSNNDIPVYASYKEIPGITKEEISAVEAFRGSGRSFTYGMTHSSECFVNDGRIGGFAMLYCQWLSGLFDLSFTPVIYEWNELLNGLESDAVDFTGELTAAPEQLQTYSMTGSIAERVIFITRIIGSPDPLALSMQRRPRLGFLSGSNTLTIVRQAFPYEFDHTELGTVEEAHTLLRERQLDAFIDEGQESAVGIQIDLTTTEMIPYLSNPVSMSTRNKELSPIISVVEKYLES